MSCATRAESETEYYNQSLWRYGALGIDNLHMWRPNF